MKKLIAAGLLISLPLASGCKRETVVTFEPNMVFSHAMEMETGYSMKQAATETNVAVTQFFGTPGNPLLPEFVQADENLAQLVSLDKLKLAAGAETDSGLGLYRNHCATCHGVTGNGRGETAALLDPYPRDYRLGKFKFKSTERGAKPLREDIAFSIKYGIAGTSMKVIPELTDADIDALVDYVIYLSWRGEFERNMLMEGSEIEFEVDEDGNGGDHLFAPDSSNFKEQLEYAKDFVVDIGESWLEAEERILDVPAPEGIEVPETTAEVLALAVAAEPTSLKESIEKGRQLFASELSACGKCHGPQGYGDGPTIDYDDWTKEWTLRIGVDPTNKDEQVPLVARGALPARAILPRDFREGLYRGGSSPEQLYRRIAAGIDGTPMPAATIDANEIWHLVNYIRSLAVPNPLDIAPTANQAETNDQAETGGSDQPPTESGLPSEVGSGNA